MKRRIWSTLRAIGIVAGASIPAGVIIFGASTNPPQDIPAANAEDIGFGYQRIGSNILFAGKRIDKEGLHDIDDFAKAVGRPLVVCQDVDASSFQALSEEYTKDKNSVYYKWISPGRFWVVEIPDADPDTFVVLDFNLAKDQNHVWKTDIIVVGADSETAQVVNPHWTWKDRNNVYYQSVVLKGADPATFRHLDQGFYADADQVFWCTTKLTAADPRTFETFGDVPYARDDAHVWSGPSVLRDVDAKSFKLLHNHVYKDAECVYVSTKATVVIGADSATFEKVGIFNGHKSVFEPEKHAVTFPGHDAVLFRDSQKHFVFEPDYGEMYALVWQDGQVVVSKPLRLARRSSPENEIPMISATLQGESLIEPMISALPQGESQLTVRIEKSKLQQYLPLFIAAREFMEK